MSKSVKGGEVPHPPDRRAFTLVEVVVECEFFTGQTIDVDGGGAMG